MAKKKTSRTSQKAKFKKAAKKWKRKGQCLKAKRAKK